MRFDVSKLEPLEEKLGYSFKDKELLLEALTHPSYHHLVPEVTYTYQRLEFLGDAVLSSIVADELYRSFPNAQEGDLTRDRTLLAGGRALSELARELGVGNYIFIGPGEEAKGTRDSSSVLEDALEAIVGGIFLDSTWIITRRIVIQWYGDIAKRLSGVTDGYNPKGKLQEIVQPVLGNNALSYEIVDMEGPDHNRIYKAEVRLKGEVIGRGEGSTKKQAEENAARYALLKQKDILPAK